MKMLKQIAFTLLLLLTLISILHVVILYAEPGIDAVGVVTRIIDGDTIDAEITGVNDKFIDRIKPGSVYRIRFSDINAPELNTIEGIRSKEALSSILKPGMTIYLDIDDVDVFDRYGRIVAVVYIKYNETHLLNINKWLLDNHYAEIMDFPNEFNPYTWTLYTQVNTSGIPLETMSGVENSKTMINTGKQSILPEIMLISIMALLLVATMITLYKIGRMKHEVNTPV